MANPIPPLVSNTPPIDFDDNKENIDIEAYETSDVTFNNDFIDDMPSQPSASCAKPISISALHYSVLPPDDDIIDPIISRTTENKSDINSGSLENSIITIDKIIKLDDMPLETLQNCNDDNDIDINSVEFEFKIADDHDDIKHPRCFESTKKEQVKNEYFYNDDSPPLILSNIGLDDGDQFSNEFETNDNSINFDKINRINCTHSTHLNDDNSVLSLKLDPDETSTSTSPTLKETQLEPNEYNVIHDIEGETAYQTFQDVVNDDIFIELNGFKYFQEQLKSSEILFSNEHDPTFETHFEANFMDAKFPVVEKNEELISEKIKDKKSILNNISENDFDDFQDFKAAPTNMTNQKSINAFTEIKNKCESNEDGYYVSDRSHTIDDRDEFGEFKNFNQLQVIPEKLQLEVQQLNVALTQMFPFQEMLKEHIQINIKNYVKIENNKLLGNLLGFDSTAALNYQWNNSNANQMLVKSLGIDARNILFGSKWKSLMPRYAANLGFNPLEPLKPTSSTISNSNCLNKNASPVQIHSDTNSDPGTDVPAVQFDWNSAGLVNPLDGEKDAVRETSFPESQTITNDINSITNYSSPTTIIQFLNALPVVSEPNPTITRDLEILQEHNNDKNGANTTYVPSSTGNLRETHIFTPNKSINPVSRDVSCLNMTADESANIELEEIQLGSEIKINKNVITKEYRDVEYELPVSNDILQPIKLNNNATKNSSTNIIINWPDPGDFSPSLNNAIVSNHNDDDFDFNEFQSTNTITYDPRDDDIEYTIELCPNNFENNNTNCPILTSPVHTPKITNIDTFLKPTIGLSPTEELKLNYTNNDIDDEFTEFQYVSPSTICISSATTSNSLPTTLEVITNVLTDHNNMFLQPTIHATGLSNVHSLTDISNKNKQSINSVWTDSSVIDFDEINRIESAFANNRTKTNTMHQQRSTILGNKNKTIPKMDNKDEDEWSDFVSSSTVGITNLNTTNEPNLVTNTTKTSVNDDWSEFVSGLPIVPIPSSRYKSIPSQKEYSQPNFSSWNSPINYNSYKQITSRSLVTPNLESLPQSSQNIQNIYSTHHNGILLNSRFSILDTDLTNNQHDEKNVNNNISNISNNNYNNNTKSQKQPNISLIPDLGFISPKNLINVPRNNFTTKK